MIDRTFATGRTLLVAGLLWGLPHVSAGQSTGAAISGTVRDDGGAPLAGALVQVDAADTGTSREAVADAQGRFAFTGVRPATALTLTASMSGFGRTRTYVPPLSAGEHRLLDVRLAPAGVAETVEVSADASDVRTSSPALGGRLSRGQVDRVPANGRDLVAMAYLVPGAAPARGFYNLAPRLTINGASSLVTNYTIDGFDNTDLFLGGPKVPATVGSTDSLQVLVNAYAPEHGRTGSGVFAVTTRAGTNVHRGEAFYTLRPGAVVDAPNAFAPRDATGAIVDDSFQRHQAGGSFGGPVRAGRAFYFSDVEITRERQDAILSSPLAAGLAPTRFDSQTGLAKLDMQWNDRQASTLRLHAADTTHDGTLGFIGGVTLPSAGLAVTYRNQFASFGHRSLTPGGLNEFGVQVGQLRANWRGNDSGPRVIVTDQGITQAVLGAVSDDFRWTETDVQVRNVFTRMWGRHTIRAGVDVLSGDFLIDSGPGARGLYVVDLDGRAVQSTGAFLTQADLPRDVAVLSYTQSFGNPEVTGRQTLAAVFVEDVVRASANVTMTVGARWDYDSVTDTPIGRGDTNNIAPRLGLTWTPRGSTRHQVRGGFGVFYERIPFAVYSDTRFNAPDTGAISVTFAPDTPFAPPPFPQTFDRDALDRLPTDQLPPRNVQVFDPSLRSPWTAQASAGYVVALGGAVTLALDYVHSRGHNLLRRVDVNAPASLAPGTTRSVAEADATRPIVPVPGGLRLVEEDQSSGRSRFDGLYVTLRRSLRQRVALDLAYTLSRARNDTDDINFRPVDSRVPDAEFGPGLNDRRHVLALNGLVQLPRGIDLVPVVFASSGQPLNVTTGRDDNGDTIFNDRPAGIARNSERTPGFAQVDLGLLKRLRAGRAMVTVRADAFNLFNRTNFSGFFNWGASGVRPDEQGTLAFAPTQAGPARQFQLTASVRF